VSVTHARTDDARLPAVIHDRIGGTNTANAGTIGTNQDRVQKKAPCNGAIYYSYAVCGQVYKTPGGQHLWQLCTDGSAGITGATFNSAKGHGWDDSAPFSEYLWGYAYFK
jgi:hypothetical protein